MRPPRRPSPSGGKEESLDGAGGGNYDERGNAEKEKRAGGSTRRRKRRECVASRPMLDLAVIHLFRPIGFHRLSNAAIYVAYARRVARYARGVRTA